MKRVIFTLFLNGSVLLSFCGQVCFAQDPLENNPGALFYQSNIYYQEGKYDLAIGGYEKIISSGWVSGNLYYNLGNSYFKKGDLGLAIVNYDRARVFIPNDSDLKSNYSFALQTLGVEQKPFGGKFKGMVSALFEHMTIDALTILLSLIYICLVVFFALSLFWDTLKKFSLVLACFMTGFFAISAYSLEGKLVYQNRFAIAVSKETDARFEPLESATAYFKIEEGDRVEVIEESFGWYKIRRFDNKTGWVEKSSFVKLDS